MNKLSIYCLCLSICLGACTERVVEGSQITVELDSGVQEELLFSSFVDSVTYIPLDVNEECFMGGIRDVLISDSSVFVLNEERTSIFVFDKNGTYKRKVEHVGNGPGEYLAINQFSYHAKDRILSVVTNTLKVIEYDESGRMIREFKTDDYFTDLYRLDDGSYLLSRISRIDEPNELLYLADPDGKHLKSLLGRDLHYKVDGSDHWDFVVFNNEVHFISPQLKHILYRYNAGKLEEEFEIKIHPEVSKEYYEDKPGILGFGDDYYRTVYCESEKWLNLTFWSQSKGLRVVLFDKVRKQYVVARNFKNDMDDLGVGDFLSASEENTFTGYIETEDLDQNPIIQVLHLKN